MDRSGRRGVGSVHSRSSEPRTPGEELLYGRNAVLEALHGRRSLHRLLVAEGVKEDDRIKLAAALAGKRGIGIERIARQQLDDLSKGANHQGLALRCGPYPYASLDQISQASGTILVLDHLQDPQNAGTLIRALEAAAGAGLVIARDRAVEITPAVVNASAGAAEHVLIARESNLSRAIELLKEAGRWAIGLDSGPDAVDLFAAPLPAPAMLVVGAEGKGISPLVRRACDRMVEIPMAGRIASLNAATAGAIALFEIVRRERMPAPS